MAPGWTGLEIWEADWGHDTVQRAQRWGLGRREGLRISRSGITGSGVRGRGILFHQRPGIHLTRV